MWIKSGGCGHGQNQREPVNAGRMTVTTLISGVRPAADPAAGCFYCGLPLGATVFPVALDGAEVMLLSGDHPARAVHTARELGIRVARGGATPEEKLAQVRDLQRGGAVVAMVGDGINYAPVLAQAQVSIALRSGTELAQSAADIVLMTDRLGSLVDARRYAKRTLRIIHQNLVWAALYNAVALPLAIAGLGHAAGGGGRHVRQFADRGGQCVASHACGTVVHGHSVSAHPVVTGAGVPDRR